MSFKTSISIYLISSLATPVFAEYQKKPALKEKQALESNTKKFYEHNFSRLELRKTKIDLQRRQLIIELIYAFRYRMNSSIPYLINKLGRIDPDGTEYNYFQAMYEYRQNNHGRSLFLVNKALATNAGYARGWNLKGLLASHAQKNEEAFIYFDKALKHAPFNPTYSYNAAFLHYKLKEYEKAEQRIKYALNTKNNYAEGYYLQALIERDRKQIQKSLIAFTKAKFFGYRSYEFSIQFAYIALQAKDLNTQFELIKDLQKIPSTKARELLGTIYMNFGEFKKAIYLFKKISMSKNTNSESRIKYAICLARLAPTQMHRLKALKTTEAELQSLEKVFQEQVKANKTDLQIRDQILNPIR